MNPLEKHFFDCSLSERLKDEIEDSLEAYKYLTNPHRGEFLSEEELYNEFASGNGAWVLENYDIDGYTQILSAHLDAMQELQDDLEGESEEADLYE